MYFHHSRNKPVSTLRRSPAVASATYYIISYVSENASIKCQSICQKLTQGISGCQRLCSGVFCSQAFNLGSTVMIGIGVLGGIAKQKINETLSNCVTSQNSPKNLVNSCDSTALLKSFFDFLPAGPFQPCRPKHAGRIRCQFDGAWDLAASHVQPAD